MVEYSRLVSAHLALQDLSYSGDRRARFFLRELYGQGDSVGLMDAGERMDDFLEFVLEENPRRIAHLAANYEELFEILELRKDVLIRIATRRLEQ